MGELLKKTAFGFVCGIVVCLVGMLGVYALSWVQETYGEITAMCAVFVVVGMIFGTAFGYNILERKKEKNEDV